MLSSRSEPVIVLTTVNAVLQRVPPRVHPQFDEVHFAGPARRHEPAHRSGSALAGYTRTGTMSSEQGEYAVRGGILDMFPPGRARTPCVSISSATPLESIKAFDPKTQRTAKPLRKLILMPVSEVAFGEAPTALFRTRYVELFGGATGDDPMYEAVSAGSRYSGQEHWLPLYHEHARDRCSTPARAAPF